jgi:hypothetical protein
MSLSETQLGDPRDQLSHRTLELTAIDLLPEPRWREFWFSEETPGPGGEVRDELPAEGFASPWGYWFCPSGSLDGADGAFEVSVHEPSEFEPLRRVVEQGSPIRAGDRMAQEVSLNGRGNRASLRILMKPDRAYVFADTKTWENLREPALLVVAQYARYSSIEQAFVNLQGKARRDYRHGVTAELGSIRQHRRLVEDAQHVRSSVSDWAYFAGPCSDPARICSSVASYEAYCSLVEGFDLGEWSESIDAIVEDVEQSYEALSDKLFHYRLFVWGMAAEAVIIALIIALIVR